MDVDKDIPLGSIVYWNNRYQKWYILKKGLSKRSHKILGVMTDEGVQTQGTFTVKIA